jgi:hypothetical protein
MKHASILAHKLLGRQDSNKPSPAAPVTNPRHRRYRHHPIILQLAQVLLCFDWVLRSECRHDTVRACGSGCIIGTLFFSCCLAFSLRCALGFAASPVARTRSDDDTSDVMVMISRSEEFAEAIGHV